jgi:hypothetical protein
MATLNPPLLNIAAIAAIRQKQTFMKFATDRPYADPEKAARKLIEIANAAEALQDGRIYIELINEALLFGQKASPAEYKAAASIWR